MTQQIRLADFNDFSGGLNLNADAFLLQPNESPDLLNVDIDPRGGFRQRRGTVPFSTVPFTNAPTNLWEFNPRGSGSSIMASADGRVWKSTGGAFTDIGVSLGAGGRVVRACSFKDRCYMTDGVSDVVRYDGATATTLTHLNWVELTDATAGSRTDMPWGNCIASHMGSVWVGNVTEGAYTFPNRVRWSHPNNPEAWRSQDYIDVDPGVDGDEIVALVPADDHLLVFKRNSVHAIYGYNHETYQVIPKSQVVGAVSQEAVVATEAGVFFWNWPQGVFVIDNDGIRYLYERLQPSIERGDVSPNAGTHARLGWGNRRLWVSVPWQSSTLPNRSFVFDPAVGKNGAWTQYDLPAGPFVEWSPAGQRSQFLAVQPSTRTVIELDRLTPTDNFTGTPQAIESRLRTGWVDLGQPAVRKRWKRPQIVLKVGTSADIYVKVYRDWDPTFFTRQFVVDVEADGDLIAVPIVDPGSGDVVAGTGWDTAEWDVALWGRGTTGEGGQGSTSGPIDRNELHRGSPLGTAYAVALEFIGPKVEANWGVDSLTFKYKPRKVRS